MPHDATIDKVFSFLLNISDLLKEEREVSIKTICIINKMPTEYSKFLIEEKIILKIGGKRGIANYKWDENIIPTKEMALTLIEKYNNIRQQSAASTDIKKKTYNEKIFASLEEIKVLLNKIINHEKR